MEKLPGSDPFIKPWMIDRANDHYALDITRARTLLGREPRRSLRGTLPKMIAALKADPLGFYGENDLKPPSGLQEQAETIQNPENHDAHDKNGGKTGMMKEKPAGEHSQMKSHGSIYGMDGMDPSQHGQSMWRESLRGSFVNLLLGAWLMFAPFALGSTGTAADSDHYERFIR